MIEKKTFDFFIVATEKTKYTFFSFLKKKVSGAWKGHLERQGLPSWKS